MVAQATRRQSDPSEQDPQSQQYPLVHNEPGVMSLARRTEPQIRRAPSSGNLYDVLDLILDKGIVIDAFVRVSVVGIELLTIDARVVIASVDTYMRYAEAAERLNIYERDDSANLKEMTQGGKGKSMEKGAEKVGRALGGAGDDDEDDEAQDDRGDEDEGVGSRVAQGMRHVLKRGVGRIMERLSGQEGEDDARDGDDDDEDQPNRRQKQQQKHGREGGGKQDRDRGRGGAHAGGSGNGSGGRGSAGVRRR
jgi:hypothetical protein